MIRNKLSLNKKALKLFYNLTSNLFFRQKNVDKN